MKAASRPLTLDHRVIERETLDDLPANDPRAIHSRRDLRRVNAWMGHAGIIARVLKRAFRNRPPQSIVELGAGDGTLLLALSKRLDPAWKPHVTLIDQQQLVEARTKAAFAARGWNVQSKQIDLFEWAESETAPKDLIIANLFLHHFTDDQLRSLFARISTLTRVFVACEPLRSQIALGATSLMWVIGCNDLTRHDGRLSIRAGFADHELSQLWPRDRGWDLHEGRAGWVSHCFTATAKATAPR